MVMLIKSGAFDELYADDRIAIMNTYLDLISEKKKRITLQNMQALVERGLIPEELDFERRLFNFNKYIKKKKHDDYYLLDQKALNFYETNYGDENLFDVSIGNNSSAKIKQTKWDMVYQKGMNPIRDWMSEKQQEILQSLNQSLVDELFEKYADGNISKWEMDSLGFYYHQHELSNLDNERYEISDFFELPEEPIVDSSFITHDGTEINLFKISRIAGTVIDKDKNKSQITLLTPTGVVVVKIWKNQYAMWDKQISERGDDGVKHIIEKSFFTKGNKLIITGIRRGDNFIPKKYKSTGYEVFEKIVEMDKNGIILQSQTERLD